MSDESKALVPIEEKQVSFYGDELIAVRIQEPDRDSIYVPLRPIIDNLGMAWSGQYERLQRDTILSEAIRGVRVTRTPKEGGAQEMVALPLKFIPGFLFGINANRVREEIRDRILRYQRECYDVLWESFQEGRLTAEEDFESLLQRADPDVVQAYQVARAVVRLARNQILMESRLTSRLDEHEQQIAAHKTRLEEVEAALGDPGRAVTPSQASQISQAVKAVAFELGKRTKRNEYQGVYGELYRRFGITSYKLLPSQRFQEAMKWLTEWYQSITDNEVPF